MARPVDKEKRKELCRRAVEVLRVEGLEISNTRLAEVLEIKRPTLLYYFPDRIAIFEQALSDLLSEQASFVLQRMMQHEHPIDQLFEQVRSVHAFHHGKEERVLFLTQALAVAGAERTKNIVDIGNQAFAAQREAMAARLQKGIDDGIVHPCDPHALISICRAMNDGLTIQRVMTGIDLAPVHQLLWEGLLKPLKCSPKEKEA